jgi:replicative DNA helicase
MGEGNGTRQTIDERLEALMQSVEMLAEMQIKTEAEQAKTTKELRRLARMVRVIVIDHEARLNLEGIDGEEE